MGAYTPIPPVDRRHTDIQHLDLPYMFEPPETREEWMKRARALREQIQVGLGLIPSPEKCPLNPQISDKIEHEDYTVEKVYFQSLPGFYVTGNLYRPLKSVEPGPAVLNPHGHWKNGRFENSEDGSIPGRCIELARMGCVAFAYDMIGYNDSRQLDHRSFGGQRLELWGISMMGLQVWNSIRSIDFLESLPDVDKRRIACTGCSGGATQTFILTAVDDRIMLSSPVNMISNHMQGGCICENGPLMRIGTNNIEIGALMAPRPMLMISATGDWTVNSPNLEYPTIREVYRLFEAEENLSHVQIDAGHNYNKDSRNAMYPFFSKWLFDTEVQGPYSERSFAMDPLDQLTVFGDGPLPDGAVDEEGLVDTILQKVRTRFDKNTPDATKELRKFRLSANVAFRAMIGASVPAPADIVETPLGMKRKQGYSINRIIVGSTGKGDRVPALVYEPNKKSRGAVLVVHPGGSDRLIDDDGNPSPVIDALLEQRQTVMTIDTFGTGEGNPKPDDSAFQFGTTYNHTKTAYRIQDIITGVTSLRERTGASTVGVIGSGDAGLWCLIAAALDPHIARATCDTLKFNMSDDQAFLDKLFIPCFRRAGDLRTAVALAAPAELLLHNTGGVFETEWMEEIYRVADSRDRLRVARRRAPVPELVDWAINGASEAV